MADEKLEGIKDLLIDRPNDMVILQLEKPEINVTTFLAVMRYIEKEGIKNILLMFEKKIILTVYKDY